MKKRRICNSLLGWTLFALTLWLVTFRPAVAASHQEKSAAPPQKQTAEYVGADVCKTCHEDLYKNSFEGTPHFQTTLKDGHGCESCHGPGSEHVAGGGDKTKIVTFTDLSRQQSSARCLSCHGDSRKQRHFSSSSHASNDVGCLDCHSPHKSKEPQHLLVRAEPELCYGCHVTAKADFSKPYHHRVNEGLVGCDDCHNVHGTTTIRQLKAKPNGDAVCFQCHVDKQGPFVYEHVPVKTEGCTACHTPHGSTNPRFLRVSQVNLMCLQCHTFPVQSPQGPSHNQSAKYQACTMCHTAIHGSNVDPAFFR